MNVSTWRKKKSGEKRKCGLIQNHHGNKDHTITITEDAKDQVVAVGTILVERKFVHKNGLVGHIEDIAVNSNQQGKKLGLRIIQALKFIGAQRGCYKGKLLFGRVN